MHTVELLVIGGGPTGHAAARAYVEAAGGLVMIVSDDADPPAMRPALSKEYLRGEIERDALWLGDEDWWSKAPVDLRLATSCEAIDPQARTARLAGGETIRYGDCLLATGAMPVRPPLPGADADHVRTLRRVADADRLIAAAAGAARAVVVGTGFIGCEAAASLAMRGLHVDLVGEETVPQAARLGDAVGQRIAGWLGDLGVGLHLGQQVERVDRASVTLADGRGLPADLILLATGVKPRSGLAEHSRVAVRDGRILVDEHMRTGTDGVWAAGDVALAHNAAAGRRLVVEHWGEAEAMGAVAGAGAAGGEASWNSAPGFWSTIGRQTLKQVAWGDGFDEVVLDADPTGPFTAWYGREGRIVGVVTHDRDDDYERGRTLVEAGAPLGAGFSGVRASRRASSGSR